MHKHLFQQIDVLYFPLAGGSGAGQGPGGGGGWGQGFWTFYTRYTASIFSWMYGHVQVWLNSVQI